MFDIDVFSVEEGCNKSLTDLHADMSVASFAEKVKCEFGLASRLQIQFLRGDRQLAPSSSDALVSAEAGLGLRPCQQLAFVLLNKPFTLKVVSLGGEQICATCLYTDSILQDVFNEVHHVNGKNLRPGCCWQLISRSGKAFKVKDGLHTMSDLGIDASESPMTCILGAEPLCSQCNSADAVRNDT